MKKIEIHSKLLKFHHYLTCGESGDWFTPPRYRGVNRKLSIFSYDYYYYYCYHLLSEINHSSSLSLSFFVDLSSLSPLLFFISSFLSLSLSHPPSSPPSLHSSLYFAIPSFILSFFHIYLPLLLHTLSPHYSSPPQHNPQWLLSSTLMTMRIIMLIPETLFIAVCVPIPLSSTSISCW